MVLCLQVQAQRSTTVADDWEEEASAAAGVGVVGCLLSVDDFTVNGSVSCVACCVGPHHTLTSVYTMQSPPCKPTQL
jgi:hypothetical protein